MSGAPRAGAARWLPVGLSGGRCPWQKAADDWLGASAWTRQGRRSGDGRGRAAGAGAAEHQQAAIAEAEAAERQRLEEAEAAERAANCGAPLFVDGYCPTDRGDRAGKQHRVALRAWNRGGAAGGGRSGHPMLMTCQAACRLPGARGTSLKGCE